MTQEENQHSDSGVSREERFRETIERLRRNAAKLWASRRKIFYINGIIAIVVASIMIFVVNPYYESSVRILPEYGATATSMLNQLSGLASLAGVSVGATVPTEIYEKLITSESVLAPVIYAKYKSTEITDSVNFIEYADIEPDRWIPVHLRDRARFLEALEYLREDVLRTDFDRITQILTLTVKMPEGQLSADIANKIAASLDSYIQTQIRTNAREQRKYIEKRIRDIKDSLTVAEDLLKDFRERNTLISQSPTLMLDQQRFVRNVEILNAVYLQLAQQAELVKIQEVKDTPVIIIDEEAKDPVLKAGPRRAIAFAFMMVLSIILTCLYYLKANSLIAYYRLFKG